MIFYQRCLITSNKWFILHKKIEFSIKDFFSKCDQIRSFLRIWSHLLKKFLMENIIFWCSIILENKSNVSLNFQSSSLHDIGIVSVCVPTSSDFFLVALWYPTKTNAIFHNWHLLNIFFLISQQLPLFSPTFHFYAPWKRQKRFLTFSGGIEMEHWAGIG